ncbi:diacylglycerol/lipid kinase family protein [Corynebacterium freiburgense]|uniref:diacylglycerol/lipid kinase family protein n=1 Tax=Corynebacterium freiburgense TaxID=556548 RepID=UPI0003FCEDA5|nr:diacylglycerol kinase family protein [Corynebacterium freiburgense]WJZ02571.1 Diacylglycerol kinase [Corynebacterium freiburgense]
MNAQRIGIVWNPSKTTKEHLEAALQASAATTGINPAEILWFETTKEDPGQGPAQQALAAGANIILAIGGDGTIRAVAEHLAAMESEAELGIIPLGTGNLLARNLNIPINNLELAIAHALSNEAAPIDIGWAEISTAGGIERHAFAVMAGFGIDAHIINETSDELKDKAGWLAYIESLGRAVSASEIISIKLGINGKKPHKEHAHTIIIGNCGTLQSGFKLLPDASLTDGQLDLLVLRAKGLLGWLDSLRNMIWDNGIRRIFRKGNDALSSRSTTHQRATTITARLSEPRIFQVDGDELGKTTQITITIQPGALRIRS